MRLSSAHGCLEQLWPQGHTGLISLWRYLGVEPGLPPPPPPPPPVVITVGSSTSFSFYLFHHLSVTNHNSNTGDLAPYRAQLQHRSSLFRSGPLQGTIATQEFSLQIWPLTGHNSTLELHFDLTPTLILPLHTYHLSLLTPTDNMS